jgi:hypothetical protein
MSCLVANRPGDQPAGPVGRRANRGPDVQASVRNVVGGPRDARSERPSASRLRVSSAGSGESLGEPGRQAVRSASANLQAVGRHGHDGQAAPALLDDVRHRRAEGSGSKPTQRGPRPWSAAVRRATTALYPPGDLDTTNVYNIRARSSANSRNTTSTAKSDAAAPTANPGAPVRVHRTRMEAAVTGEATGARGDAIGARSAGGGWAR